MTTETITETKTERRTPPPEYANIDAKDEIKRNDYFQNKEQMELDKIAADMKGRDLDSDSLGSASFHSSETWSSDSINIPKFFQETITDFFRSYKDIIYKVVGVVVLIGYTVYFAFAVKHSVDTALALIVITGITVFLVAYVWVRDHWGAIIYRKCMHPVDVVLSNNWYWIKWILYPAILIVVICYMALDVVAEMRQLQSLSGMVLFMIILYLFSKHPTRIQWRPVIVGFALQFFLAILVLRWKNGYDAVKWFSDQIMTFINYSLEGAATVFGNPFMVLHPFVFVIMPMLIYIGSVMSILYYLGITQTVAGKMGWFVQATMQTTAIESLAVAANIFLNGMDTMLMLRKYLTKLTKSEFHCFLVGNHSTVAGFAFATFVMFGAPPEYLISASVMSAPATIAVAKLSYPETEESCTKSQEDVQLEKGEETNVIEAAASGSAIAAKTVMAVVINYISFMGLLAFIDAFFSWVGNQVGYPELSFEVICSYLFWPLSLVMGIEVAECREVAKLIGTKVFTSEMLAYQKLGVSIANGLSARSASIATYALCGFSSFSTLAIAVGVWNSLAPSKTHEMSNQMVRVITNANISCFLTACIAGLMFDPRIADPLMNTDNATSAILEAVLGILPSYKDLLGLVGMA